MEDVDNKRWAYFCCLDKCGLYMFNLKNMRLRAHAAPILHAWLSAQWQLNAQKRVQVNWIIFSSLSHLHERARE